MKKARKCEVKFLPDNPVGQTDESLESERNALQEETKKRHPNKALIDSKMEVTFSLRRKEIVDEEPLVADVMERWPGLFLEEQFFRITRVDLKKTFLSSLDAHSLQLMKLYRSRSGKDMRILLDHFDEQTTDVLAHRKSTILRGLPFFVKEKSDGFLKKCLNTDPEEFCVKGVQLGILTVVEDDVGTVCSSPMTIRISLVIEERIVLDDVFMNIGTQCSARVQAVKNNLLR
ncbi:hypothetical protein VZT92_012534 [Zoarces viviparus]|uniref:Uncharacterized protein n=1 Tax=Zoarces viviparus TaxID=48416 RepID=A0AAW1F1A6_ZOAVI